MNLQTQIKVTPGAHQIDYDSQLLLLGSCFTENMGAKLEYFKFQNLQNPFGVLFNPLSIAKLVTRALNGTRFNEEDIFQKDGVWHCFEVHSLVFNSDKQAYLNQLNDLLSSLKNSLLSSSHIIFSFGTAWAHRLNESSEIVANCHKVPQKEFTKELLEVDTMVKMVKEMVVAIQKVNPRVQFIFTISPVRHIKDGFVQNNLSKSHLIAAVHEVVASTQSTHYFPSYEIMMDELRDYRFYKRDMIHPNETAIEIIWERFNSAWIDPATELLQKEIGNIQKGQAHKPFHAEGAEHQAFQERLQEKIKLLKAKLPHVSF
ncbi:MAG: GSCFA domain-containing protein [Flavobacteriaceae bacterium]|nr:GSCFA domain-containing protein [Flavobacteriaceae bacterium]